MSFKQGCGYLGAFVMGATTGFVAGMLTAPASGDETRRRLSWKLDEGKSRLRRTGQRVVDDTAARLEHGIESGRQKLDQVLEG
jgi:gas vesicle protein